MVWVGDDASDSDYEVLEEPTSTPAPSSVSRQGVWNPSKLSLVLLFLSKRGVERILASPLRNAFWDLYHSGVVFHLNMRKQLYDRFKKVPRFYICVFA